MLGRRAGHRGRYRVGNRMRREIEQCILAALGSGGITGLNVDPRSPSLACSRGPSSLLQITQLLYFLLIKVVVWILQNMNIFTWWKNYIDSK